MTRLSVLTNAKQFLADKAVSAAKKAGNGIAALSSLSPKQLLEIDEKRRRYLTDMPDMEGGDAQNTVQKNLGAIGIEVYQAYLGQLRSVYRPVVIPEEFDEDNRIRFFDITKWVTDTEEHSIDKLANVYHVLSGDDCNIALIYHRTTDCCRITIGIVNTDPKHSDPSIADNYYSRITGAVRGNFPGSDMKEIHSSNPEYGIGIPDFLQNITGGISGGKVKSVASVSNVPSEKSEDFISQSMEKLLDGIVPENKEEEYTIVLLAKPVREQSETKNRLYELYSALSPYCGWQSSYQYTQSDLEGSSANAGISAGVGLEMKNAVSANFGVSFARASNTMMQVGKNEGVTKSYTNYGVKHTLDVIEAQMKRIEESSALGMWEFASYIISDSPVIANNVAHMYLALTQGENSYITKSAVNLWDGDIDTEAAKAILASVQKLQHPVFGLKPFLEEEWLMYPTLVTAATPISGKELAKALNFPRKSVSGLPVLEVVSFGREPHSLSQGVFDLEIGCGYHMRKAIPKQRMFLSMQELTKHTFITGSTGSGKSNTIYKLLENLSKAKVHFLVVEPAKGEYKKNIGKNKGVTTYGTNPNISDMPLLRLNPFRFPLQIHILEHLDRLVEIFNVCWPMYAAMPAILKDAVERAYVKSGWDLEKSTNRYSSELFPTFQDVVQEIKQVLKESDYSDDNKGDYTGALVTRLKSLTNGINGLIFSADDLADEQLFDKNVIVDLSRVGSAETKSLIMGLLVLKLQEHRMEQRSIGANTNDYLKHVTILEEAHRLLKRTSTEQTGEGANMLGKSVEMLANAIAEMRTYGEGFIIADQSPGLLDLSVIRNTNTKMILRLPDYSDRELAGKAAGLSDNQIAELARFEKGVAVVSQSGWLEPVLCKVDFYTGGEAQEFTADPISEDSNPTEDDDAIEQALLACIMKKELSHKGERTKLCQLKDRILKSRLDTVVKCDFFDCLLSGNTEAAEMLRKLAYDFFKAEDAIKASEKCKNMDEWVRSVADKLSPKIHEYSDREIDYLMGLLVYEQSVRDASYNDLFCRYTEIYQDRGGVC